MLAELLLVGPPNDTASHYVYTLEENRAMHLNLDVLSRHWWIILLYFLKYPSKQVFSKMSYFLYLSFSFKILSGFTNESISV